MISKASLSDSENDYSSGHEKVINNYPLKSFIWIIHDYYNNGLIFTIEKEYKKGGDGKINWSRTFKTIPFSNSDAFIYMDLVAEQKSRTDDILTFIHEYCLKTAIREIGWIFGCKNPGKITDLTVAQKKYYEQFLLKERMRTFSDRKKILIEHLLRIVRYSLGKNDHLDRSEIGTYRFYNVWEKMIQKVYGNKPLEEFFPNAIWCIDDIEKDGPSLRPDTVMEILLNDKKYLYILDAKYYRYGLHNDMNQLPGSSDVQKQITYGDHAMLRHKEYGGRIKSAFVLPFCSDSEEKIRVVGHAKSNWLNEHKSHQYVYLVLMDAEYLIDNYLTDEHCGRYLEEMADLIEEYSLRI